ncbi:MAG: aldo/keto reductase [Rhodocyclaceae bacterium]|nr:aldo/keto reductase [Rhodocyclaceae bacterium]
MIGRRAYGLCDFLVSEVGLGAAQIGNPQLDDRSVASLLDLALESGVTLFDTAPSYGHSEDRLGKFIQHKRHKIIVSTKFGYGVDGIADWTGPCVSAGIDQALKVLRTDFIDIAHLHSCPQVVLEEGSVIEALADARRQGKVRAIAYSGDGDALAFALGCGEFDGFMASFNVCDQRVRREVFPVLAGRGFIAKRPLANSVWRHQVQPIGEYGEPYWLRLQKMRLSTGDCGWGETALRFVLVEPTLSSAIVGTGNSAHLLEALSWSKAGVLPPARTSEIRDAFEKNDVDWVGQV